MPELLKLSIDLKLQVMFFAKYFLINSKKMEFYILGYSRLILSLYELSEVFLSCK